MTETTQALVGKKHVIDVYRALVQKQPHATADYIRAMYPSIAEVKSKFDFPNPDQQPDLTVTLTSNEEVKINLFSIKGNGKIQPKNLGAKSFISKYFGSQMLQDLFTNRLESELVDFYKEILEGHVHKFIYENSKLLKEEVKKVFPKFTDGINPYRTAFLTRIRDVAFNVLTELYNADLSGLENTFKALMLTDSVNLITRFFKNGDVTVETWLPQIDYSKEMQLYKKGTSTVGIRIGTEALTLRFKFESSPNTPIKIATSYEEFPDIEKLDELNSKGLLKFEQVIMQHKQTSISNASNAIGKCNEAIVYYQLLKRNPTITQVDSERFIEMLLQYSPIVKEETLKELEEASNITYETIHEYLASQYKEYVIESIELVPENYIKDRLDTTDLKVIIKNQQHYQEIGLSLKAIATEKSKITVKNPGAGQILGPTYFHVGSLVILLEELKAKYENGEVTHMECLEIISAAVGEALENAPQENLQKGLTALIGSAPKVVTIYRLNKCKIVLPEEISTNVVVKKQAPTKIQTTFEDPKNNLQLTLRAKFSAGQSKGWSSVKFAGEMRV